MKRADGEKLREIFNKYASQVDADGERFMTPDDFIRKYLGLYKHDDYSKSTVLQLGSLLDTSKDG